MVRKHVKTAADLSLLTVYLVDRLRKVRQLEEGAEGWDEEEEEEPSELDDYESEGLERDTADEEADDDYEPSEEGSVEGHLLSI